MQDTKARHDSAEPSPRVVVVGAGQWGRNYVRELANRSALAAIVDPYLAPEDGSRLTGGSVPVLVSVPEAVREVEFDGAVISTPAMQHAATAEYLLTAGKHVLVEKPVAFALDELSRLYATADARDLILMSGHLLQHHPAVTALSDLCQDGKIGQVRFIGSIRTSLGTIRSEENVIWSFGPHDIGLAMSIMKCEPNDVEVEAVSVGNTVDIATLRLAFDGAEAHIHLNWLSPIKEQRLTVVGERGLALFDDRAEWPDKLRIAAYRRRQQDVAPGSSAVPLDIEWTSPTIVKEAPLSRQVDEFLRAMREGATDSYDHDRWLTLGIIRTLERTNSLVHSVQPGVVQI